MDLHCTYTDRNTRVDGLRVRFCGMTGIGSLADCVVLDDYTRRYAETDTLCVTDAGEAVGSHTKHVQQHYRAGQLIKLDAHRLTPTPVQR